MNVIMIDESNFKQLVKSRRILSKYFQQVSSRAYIGQISSEGLDYLHQELKSITNRYTSIACFKVVTRARIELQWILGNKNNFDTDGTFCFRQENIRKLKAQKKEEKIKKQKDLIKKEDNFITPILELAALFHDIGKVNIAFQEKLKNGGGCEPLRHDVLSFLMMEKLFLDICCDKDSGVTDDKTLFAYLNKLDFKDKFLNKDKIDTNLSDEEVKDFFMSSSERDFKSLCERLNNLFNNKTSLHKDSLNKEDFKFTILLLWLVLTHHKIIDRFVPKNEENTNSNQDGLMMLNNPNGKINKVLAKIEGLESYGYFNKCNYTKKDENNENGCKWEPQEIDNNFKIDRNKENYLPWKDDIWLKKVKEAFENLVTSIEKEKCLSVNDLAHIALLYLRPSLLTSDFLGSIHKREIKLLNEKDVYANTIRDEIHDSSKGKEGDTLRQHLKTVAEKTNIITEILSNQKKYFRYIDFNNDIDKNSSKLFKKENEILSEKFLWQDKVEEDINKLENKNLPFFGVVVSETGSGKTLIAPKIIKSLNSKSRFTLALGFRSLVLQTGKSYEENLGIDKKKNILTTIIGNNITQKIFENEQKSESVGSESLDLANDDFSLTEEVESEKYGTWHNKLFEDIDNKELYSDKMKNIIDYPIVVCTIDYLIRIVEQLKSRDVFSFLRNYSADLILDEIDNYSPNDLISLTKLCFLQGLAGKNLILMSATITQFMFNEFFSAYKNGLNIYQKLNKKNNDFNVGMFSNLKVNNFCKGISTNNIDLQKDIEKEYKDFINLFSTEQVSSSTKKHKFDMTIITKNWKNEIISKAKKMHSHHNFKIDGVSVSMGFVRFNNTSNAVKLAQFIWEEQYADKNDETVILAQCYHSKMSLLVLNYIEKNLNKHLNRKNNNALEIYAKQLINERNLQNCKNIILIVSTTSIQETGRDHDYDWTILEPMSTRSLIQAAGRVRRHRDGDVKKINISLLSNPIKEIEGKGKDYWSRPGIEDEGLYILNETKNTHTDKFSKLKNESKLKYNFTIKNNDLIVKNLQNKILNSYDGFIFSGLIINMPDANDILQNYEYLSHFKSLSFYVEKGSQYANYKYYEENVTFKYYKMHAKETSFRKISLNENTIIINNFKFDEGKLFSDNIKISFPALNKQDLKTKEFIYKDQLCENLLSDNNSKDLCYYDDEKMIYKINEKILKEELENLVKDLKLNKTDPDSINLFFESKININTIKNISYTYQTGFFKI